MKFTIPELQAELARILTNNNPDTVIDVPVDDPVLPGEKLIGSISDPVTQRLMSLGKRIGTYLEDYTSTVGANNKPKEAEEIRVHLAMVFEFARVVRKLFWINVKTQFPEAAHHSVAAAIRENWQLVVWKSEESTDMPREIIALIEMIKKQGE